MANDHDPARNDRGATQRRSLVAVVARDGKAAARWVGKDHLDERVLAALQAVPRHLFVPAAEQIFAYENRPLPIGHDQTISQPYIVALMSDLAEIAPGARVLEIGTGCGYQTAILATLGAQVTSLERIPALAESAAFRLAELGYDRVTVHSADGTLGWPDAAPYDAIVVTAAAETTIPEALIEQLAPSGRLVIPVERGARRLRFLDASPGQELLLLTKDQDGRITERTILPVAFVPLIAGAGTNEAPPREEKS